MSGSAAPPSAPAPPGSGARASWLTLLPVAAVAAVNVAGIWGITLARRGATEEANRLFAAETRSRAQALERLLVDIRSNLAFLAGSAPVACLVEGDGTVAASRREGAEGALLVFLRSHPEVVRLSVHAGAGAPRRVMRRRGGVPLLWVSAPPRGDGGVGMVPVVPRLPTSASGAAALLRLETEVAPALLLAHGDFPDRRGRLADAGGAPL